MVLDWVLDRMTGTLEKPYTGDDLRDAIEGVLRHHRATP